MTRSRRILLLTCAAALVPGAARAAVVEYDNGQLRLVDDPGAATSLSVFSTDSAVIFEGAGPRTEASRCVAAPTGISCERSGMVRLVVSLGDGDDTVSYHGADHLAGARGGGGRGKDQVHGEDGADRLTCGSGRDTIFGGDGRDRIDADTGTTRSRPPTASGTRSGAARAVTR